MNPIQLINSNTIHDNLDETIPGNKEIQKDPSVIDSLSLSKSARKKKQKKFQKQKWLSYFIKNLDQVQERKSPQGIIPKLLSKK